MDLPRALTIAGSDSGGGAGVQADLKTFAAFKVYGTCAITSVTVQNTQTVSNVHDIPADIVAQQIDAVFADIRIDAVKIGMLSSPEIIHAVASSLRHWRPTHLVLDPVMIPKAGCKLLQDSAIDALRAELLPLASVITPNLPEAEALTGKAISTRAETEEATQRLLDLGVAGVLLKGGHAADHANDFFATRDTREWLPGNRIPARNTHGTGCTLSSAITALLAHGKTRLEACREAKDFVRRAMAANLQVGHGCGPLHHFVDWY